MWTTYSSDGRITSVTPYLKGQVYGTKLKFSKRLQVTELVNMQADYKHGLEGMYKNGRPMQELQYAYDQFNGKNRYYYTTGKEQGKIQREEEFEKGYLHGKISYYNPEGEMTLEYEYKNGKKVGGGILDEE